jgi:uncharacterized damage-inducible protein DinB
MELLEHLRRQFAYDAWANQEVLAALKTRPLPRSLELLGHILSAQQLWLERIRQRPQTLPVWPNIGIDQCEEQIEQLAESWREFLGQISSDGLSEKVTYKNSQGEPWANTMEDILTHVLLHSAYHRGQVASQTRAAGDTPAYTDFIHAVRQGFIQ